MHSGKTMLQSKFVVIGLYVDDSIEQAYSQLNNLENVLVVKNHNRIISILIKKALGLERYLWATLRKYGIPRILSRLICNYEVGGISLSKFDSYHFILIESPQAISPGYIEQLRRQFKQSTFSLVMVNSLKEYGSLKRWVSQVDPIYNHIITCNKSDAQSNGWLYYPDCYTPCNLPIVEPDIDVLFLASDKGRGELALKIYERLTGFGYKCDFTIVGEETDRVHSIGEFKVIPNAIPYEKYLAKLARCKCILEIVANGEQFCTLRTMEAVSYGKKLITNNASLVEEPFYNKEHMMVFKSPSDISCRFIDDEVSERAADNPFLPENLLSYLEGV